jgi:hypothetical protein
MRSKALAVAAAAALVGSGLLAGTVIGEDGANAVAERLAGDFGAPRLEQAKPAPGQERDATAAKKKGNKRKRKPKKPKVLHGFGSPVEVAGEASDAVALRCPKRYPVPVSAGLATEDPGIFPGYIGRAFEFQRAMLVAVVNTTTESASWTPTIVCMRGVKEVG